MSKIKHLSHVLNGCSWEPLVWKGTLSGFFLSKLKTRNISPASKGRFETVNSHTWHETLHWWLTRRSQRENRIVPQLHNPFPHKWKNMLHVWKLGLVIVKAASRGVILALSRGWEGSATPWRQAEQTQDRQREHSTEEETERERETEQWKVQ